MKSEMQATPEVEALNEYEFEQLAKDEAVKVHVLRATLVNQGTYSALFRHFHSALGKPEYQNLNPVFKAGAGASAQVFNAPVGLPGAVDAVLRDRAEQFAQMSGHDKSQLNIYTQLPPGVSEEAVIVDKHNLFFVWREATQTGDSSLEYKYVKAGAAITLPEAKEGEKMVFGYFSPYVGKD